MAKKTWFEKLHNNADRLPEIKEIDSEKLIQRVGAGKMVIPAPLKINELMASVPRGMVITTAQMCDYFNNKYGAVYTCPLCMGLFANIVAGYSNHQKEQGVEQYTHYWRTLKKDGEINPKFPGGIGSQIELLIAEGHRIKQKGKRFFVEDFKGATFTL